MTVKGHSITQLLLMVLHAINLFSGIVPQKYQPIVLFVIATLQGAVGVLNHYYTPQGTKIVALLILALFLGCPAMAQTPAPQPIFSVSQQAVAIHIGGQTAAGSDSIGSFTLMQDSKIGLVQLQSDNILAPEINLQSYLGGVKAYPAFLSNIFAKTSLNVAPYFHGAFGIVRNVPPTGTTVQHYSALADLGFDYKVNNTFSFGPRIGYFNCPGFGPSPHGAIVSANLTVVLGKKK